MYKLRFWNIWALLVTIDMRRIIAIVLLIFAGLLIIGVRHITAEKDFRTLSSGDESFQACISQERSYLLAERHVYLSVSKEGEPYVSKKLLYTGDLLDGDFVEIYPEFSWNSENVLKIGRFNSGQSDAIRISNLSRDLVRYVLIETYQDKLVVFDIEPNSVVNVNITYRGRLSVQGEFDGSDVRFADAIELAQNRSESSPKSFSIEIMERRAEIQTENLEFDRVKCCAVDRPSLDREF